MLHVSALTYTYPEESQPALSNVSFQVEAGECLCITGPSGCGKTTLLLAIKGLLPEAGENSAVRIAGPEPDTEIVRDGVGLVFQNADSQILCSTVAEEVAFGPENLCVPPDEIHLRIVDSLNVVGLAGFQNRNVERLSAGQKQRLTIASVLSMNPRILLLDEPTSQLDAAGRFELVQILARLKALGYTLIIVEHNLEPFRDLVDRYAWMANGRLVEITDTAPSKFLQPPNKTPRGATDGNRHREKTPIISINGLRLSYPGVGNIFNGLDLQVFKGERLHIFGRNGSGKSALLSALAGVARPDAGIIKVLDTAVTPKANLFGKIGYMLQNPQRQLFENTVFEEVAFSLKRLRLTASEIERRVGEALELCEAGHLFNKLPLALSFGEQHRVALASVLAPKPDILLLDEPFSGLDFMQRHRLLAILTNLTGKCGTAIVIASHDFLPEPDWPDRIVNIENSAEQ